MLLVYRTASSGMKTYVAEVATIESRIVVVSERGGTVELSTRTLCVTSLDLLCIV